LQVVFCNSAYSGALILGALYVGSHQTGGWLGTLAAVGCVSATAAAAGAGVDPGTRATGLMGFNGTLVCRKMALYRAI
jgi:urea transporter